MTDRAEGRVVGAGDVELYWQAWLPPSPRGVLLLCHGLGEHAGRYGNVVDAVVPDGWAVYGLDQRGHGLSGGRRAHIERYADLPTDFDVFRRAVFDRHPDLPVVLLGHSMGGQIALAYALDHQDDLVGLVLSASALAGEVVPKPVVPLLRALGRVAPRLRPAGIDVTKISKDPAVVAGYQADRLVHHGKPTLALGLGVVGQFAVLPERARTLTLPLLLQHGSADALTDPAGTRLLADTAGSADKTVRWYEGLWHEIYNEPERARPLADLREWLRRTFP